MTSNVFDTGVHELRRNWGWLLALGIVLIFLGVIALIDSVAVSVMSIIFFGWVLIFAGIVEAVQAFRHRNGSHFFLHVLDAVFSFIDNIRYNAIAPGAVGGQRIENVLQGRAKAEGKSVEEERASALSTQDLKRFVDPKDIAALCVFLASDAGKLITGQVIPIDNGALKAA